MYIVCLAFGTIFQHSGVLAAQGLARGAAWTSLVSSLLLPHSSLLRLLPNLVDNLVNRVLANVLPDLVRTYPGMGSKEHRLSPDGGSAVQPPSLRACR